MKFLPSHLDMRLYYALLYVTMSWIFHAYSWRKASQHATVLYLRRSKTQIIRRLNINDLHGILETHSLLKPLKSFLWLLERRKPLISRILRHLLLLKHVVCRWTDEVELLLFLLLPQQVSLVLGLLVGLLVALVTEAAHWDTTSLI